MFGWLVALLIGAAILDFLFVLLMAYIVIFRLLRLERKVNAMPGNSIAEKIQRRANRITKAVEA